MMQYFVGFFPGSAEADNGCDEKLNICLIASCVRNIVVKKLSKSDISFVSYNRKCLGCFFRDTV